ncbi:MAG: nicotinate (nicotinamide) nucleotide adenylyltransferase [Treponema sp.]|nr:nicotinate (nicotinamide) nucleotide adenylyltransferase [Treponema sp.]
MKIAVLGGSFNPVHNAHVSVAAQVCDSLGYDRVLFIPAYKPPHKEMNGVLSAEHRLKMLELVCEDDSRFVCEDCEIKREGVSYTYDTVCYLEEKYGSSLTGKIGLIMGTDLFAGFKYWYKADKLAEKCTLILADRPEEKNGSSFSNHALGNFASVNSEGFDITKDSLFDSALRLENSLLSISSTRIREMAARGEDFSSLVPKKVFDYIVNGKFYGNHS